MQSLDFEWYEILASLNKLQIIMVAYHAICVTLMSRVFLLGSRPRIDCPDCSDFRRKLDAYDFLLNAILTDPNLQMICSIYSVVR